MAKKRRLIFVLATACMTIFLCCSLIVGSTYALFSDLVSLNMHIKAGNHDVTLVRDTLTTKLLDENGYLVTKTVTADKDFSGETTDNIFGFSAEELIVPGCSFEVGMVVSNNSDVAFAYWLEIVVTDGKSLAFADQLKVTVTTTKATSAYLSEGLTIGTEKAPVGYLAIGAKQNFNVKVEFVNRNDNNAAMDQSVKFDLVVYATQVTQRPTA